MLGFYYFRFKKKMQYLDLGRIKKLKDRLLKKRSIDTSTDTLDIDNAGVGTTDIETQEDASGLGFLSNLAGAGASESEEAEKLSMISKASISQSDISGTENASIELIEKLNQMHEKLELIDERLNRIEEAVGKKKKVEFY